MREARWGGWAVIVTAVTFVVYAGVALVQYAWYGTSHDLTIFSQALSEASHFRAPTTLVKAPGFSIFADHFHPLILLLVPAYWVHDGAATLLVCQAFALALTCGIITASAERRIGWPGVWLGIATACSVGFQAHNTFDFHEGAVAAPVLALAGVAFVQGRTRGCLLWSALFLLSKEDAALTVLGIALALVWRGKRWAGIGLGIVSLAYLVVAMKVIIPAFSPYDAYSYRTFESVGGTVRTLATALVWPGWATLTLMLLLASTGFLALRSPLLLAGLIPALARASIDNFRYWVPAYHYPMLTTLAFGLAAFDALARGARPWRAWRVWVIGVAVASLLAGPLVWAMAQLEPGKRALGDQALRQIPAGASVIADSSLGSHLASRNPTYNLRPEGLVTSAGAPLPEIGWAVLDTRTRNWDGPGWVPRVTAELEAAGFRPVWRNERFVVLRNRSA